MRVGEALRVRVGLFRAVRIFVMMLFVVFLEDARETFGRVVVYLAQKTFQQIQFADSRGHCRLKVRVFALQGPEAETDSNCGLARVFQRKGCGGIQLLSIVERIFCAKQLTFFELETRLFSTFLK